VNEDWCLFSSDNLFLRAVTWFHHVGDRIDYRLIGLLRAIFLIAAVGAALLLSRSATQRLVISVGMLLAIGDLAYLSFFNTLYSDFLVVTGAYLCGVAILLSWNFRRGAVIFSAVALLALGFSKLQYLPLASLLAFALAALVAVRHRDIAASITFVIISIAMPIVFNTANPATRVSLIEYSKANKFDTFLSTIIPASNDPLEALSTVGLPEHCAKGLGHSWWEKGIATSNICPEVSEISRAKLVPLFMADPRTFYFPIYTALTIVSPLQLDYLHNTETEGMRNSVRYRIARATSLTTYLDAVPTLFKVGLAAISTLIGFYCGIVAVKEMIYGTADLCALASFGGLLVVYAITSSVFGDGYVEIAKHAIVIGVGYALQISAAIGAMARALNRSI